MMSVREGEVERQGETGPFVRERENERDRQEREEERKYRSSQVPQCASEYGF